MFEASNQRYEKMVFKRCGRSGIKLPAISLGLWHNWGGVDIFENGRAMIREAFDIGITHFDLANNYGPPYGSAEENFGRIFNLDLKNYRDELIISSKAGWDMWPGPYGDFGSRKYLVASCDQSLKRTGLKYFDIFYHHRPDPHTPLEETMGALDFIVRSGRALYAGISQYNPEQTREAAKILNALGTPCLIHQPNYNMFDRWIEDGLTDVLLEEGIGCIVFSPLAQGILSNKYLNGIPSDSRASKPYSYLKKEQITEDRISKIRILGEIANQRGQTIAQLAVTWVLSNPAVTSALIGASRVDQIKEIADVVKNPELNESELEKINQILKNN